MAFSERIERLKSSLIRMPGEPFFVDPECNLGYLRLNFSYVAPERLAEGLRRLAEVIRQTSAAAAA